MTYVMSNSITKIVKIKKSAKARGKDCKLSERYMENVLAQTCCAYTGRPFSNDAKDKHKKRSMERLNNLVGYLDGNVIPVEARINHLKSNFTLEQLEDILFEKFVSINSKKETLDNITKKVAEHIDDFEKIKGEIQYIVNDYNDTIQRNQVDGSSVKNLNRLPHLNDKLKKSIAKVNNIKRDISSMKKNIKTLEEGIDDLLILVQSVRKYENLSFIDREKLKLGLSIDTTITDLVVEYLEVRKLKCK